jgi:hypothetical protein
MNFCIALSSGYASLSLINPIWYHILD